MNILYLNESYKEEEFILQQNGISCTRMLYPFEEKMPLLSEKTLIRGPKMKNQAYFHLIAELTQYGITPIVSVDEYNTISNAIAYTKCFGKYAPFAISFDINDDVESIAQILNQSHLQFPLFVRTDVESAAKYVGVNSCILYSSEISALSAVLEPIKKYIPNASSIIMKEIVSFQKHNNKNLEYRAVVINNKIVCFDYTESSGLPHPETLSCARQFGDAINSAYKNGLCGAYFVDFGINQKNDIFVVECKNIINGTIKNIHALAKGLKNYEKK